MRHNGWSTCSSEVMVSTPRRFGKTISVSMFAAAMFYAAPGVELSIYSTCKRISQKLLRNVVKFFHIICGQDLSSEGFKVIRQNMEEIVLQGGLGSQDVRVGAHSTSHDCEHGSQAASSTHHPLLIPYK